MIGDYAFKIPILIYGWGHFLMGLLNNRSEFNFSKMKKDRDLYARILWRIPGGFLLCMKRADPLTETEYELLDKEKYLYAEKKPCSYGWIDGKIVAVDYGSLIT